MGNDYACMIVHSTNKEFADFVSCSHIADSLPLNSFYNCRLFAVGSLHEWNERASKPLLISKDLFLFDRDFPDFKLHFFSQGIDSLCLEKLYQSNFTVANSSNGLLRIFFDFFQKKCHCVCWKCSYVADRQL